MMGTLEFLFFPDLLHPVKEAPIHGGRKRIDIRMTNGAVSGAFWWIHDKYGEPCPYIVFECKNYTDDLKNPEFDQLQGRFSNQRGKVGFICCRELKDRPTAIKRCRDARLDGRGIILPLDDATISRMLLAVEAGQRASIERVVQGLLDEVCAT